MVDFNAAPQFGMRPLVVQFNDATNSADSFNNTYLWTFGDGGESNKINPNHTYVTSGIFTVNLTVTEITGNNATLSKPYYIHIGDSVNATDFSGIPQCGLSPLPVQFIDEATLAHDQWEWNFGDGGTSNLSDPQYTYTTEGSWTVSLYISNSSGGPQSIISKTNYIRSIPAGIVSFTASDPDGTNPLSIQFHDTSTGFISPVTYQWSFGDGGMSAEQNPSHIYPNVLGLYNVTFTITDHCGQNTTNNGSVTIVAGSLAFLTPSVPGAPVSDFTGIPTSGSAPLDVTFTDLSINSPTAWNWSFGDGNYSTIRNPVHTYTSNGNYTVSLTTANSRGSSTKTRIEYIAVPGFLLAPPNEPVVNFIGTPTYGNVPLIVQFTDLSSGFNAPVTYLWDFGDGGISSTRNASHIYTTTGLHSVSLTVSGSDGQTVTEVKPGYINTEIPFIELTLIEEPLDSSLPSDDTTAPTQSTSEGQSLSMAESALEAQSLPVMQSVAPGIPEYQEQSIPMDRSFQNNLLAATPGPTPTPTPDVNPKPPKISNWLLYFGPNTNEALHMHIKSSTSWQVYVKDAMDGYKPDGTEGKMAEYGSGEYVTSNGQYLKQSIHVISRNGYDVTLSDAPRLLAEGPPCNDMDRPLIISQWVGGGDTRLENTNYRIVILFSAVPAV